MATTIDDLIVAQKQNVQDMLGQLTTFSNALTDIVKNNAWDIYAQITLLKELPDTGFNYVPDGWLDSLMTHKPTAPNIGLYASPPTIDELNTIKPITITVPDFTKDAPALSFPTRPSTALPLVPQPAPLTYPDVPQIPAIVYPTAAILKDIVIPTEPIITIPVYQNTRPVIDNLRAPSDRVSFTETPYASLLKDAMNSELLADVLDGGYGIKTIDEAGLRDRAKEDTYADTQLAKGTLTNEAAALGLPLPSGSLFYGLYKANLDATKALAALDRDVMIKREELFHEYRKAVVVMGTELVKTEMTYYGAVNERALNAAKYTIDAAVEIFNAQVKQYELKVEMYKAVAAEYNAQVQAELAKVEAYKGAMQGKAIEAEIQKNSIENYKSQIQALMVIVEIFNTQMQGAKLATEIEGMKITDFKARIDAYMALISAKTAEFQMYEVQIKGELGKVQVFTAETEAYKALISAESIKAETRFKNLDAQLKVNDQTLNKYQTQMEAYKTGMGALVQINDVAVKEYLAETEMWKARADTYGKYFGLLVSENTAYVEKMRVATSGILQKADLQLKGATAVMSAETEAAKAGMLGYANAASAAMSSLMGIVAMTKST